MYKAYIHTSFERYEYDETGMCEGVDPDSRIELGITEKSAPTLEELKSKIEHEYFNLEKPIGADVQVFDGAIEISFETDDGKGIENARIIIAKVEETYIDIASEPIFKGVAR